MGNLLNHAKGTHVVVKAKMIKSVCKARKITEILPPFSWKDQTCFVIGGGPSLQGFDWNLIKPFHTIGTNKSFQTFPAEVNYGMDYTFFDQVQYSCNSNQKNYKLHQDWISYNGIKVFLRQDHTYVFVEGIYYVDSIPEKVICFDLNRGIYATNNSGGGAIMLALALGCKNIGLLGFDLKMDGNKSHFHEGYEGQNLKSFSINLEEFRRAVDEMGPSMLNYANIVNLSPGSALKSFPKADIKTFLSQVS